MQLDEMRAAFTQRQANQVVVPLATFGVFISAVITGTWSESWMLGIVTLILSPVALAAPNLRKAAIAVFTLLWGYFGLRCGLSLGGSGAGMICAIFTAGLGFTAHGAFANILEDRRFWPNNEIQSIASNHGQGAVHNGSTLRAVFRDTNKAVGWQPSPKAWVGLGVFVVFTFTIFGVLVYELRPVSGAITVAQAKDLVGKPVSGSSADFTEYDAESALIARQLAEARAYIDASTLLAGGATVDDWRSASTAAQRITAEGWVKTAFPTRVQELGESGVLLSALQLAACVNAVVRGADGVGNMRAGEVGAMCITQLWG